MRRLHPRSTGRYGARRTFPVRAMKSEFMYTDTRARRRNATNSVRETGTAHSRVERQDAARRGIVATSMSDV